MRDLRFDPDVESPGSYRTICSRAVLFIAIKKGIQLPTKIIMDRVGEIQRKHFKGYRVFFCYFFIF